MFVCLYVICLYNGGVWGFFVDFYLINCYKLNQYVVIVFIMVGVLCLVVIFFVEFMRNRWDKKYYKYVCKYNNFIFLLGDLCDNFFYDFVVYSMCDQKWIMVKLVDYVERKNNKFCLYDRVIILGGVYVKMFLKV